MVKCDLPVPGLGPDPRRLGRGLSLCGHEHDGQAADPRIHDDGRGRARGQGNIVDVVLLADLDVTNGIRELPEMLV
jgi:hypothetical protein